MMKIGLRLSGFVYAAAAYCILLHLAVAQITDPSEVSALGAVKNSLSDPMKHRRNWERGDPCTSNWTGVLCFDAVLNDGYLHVREPYVLSIGLSPSKF
ncbi:hypothetical protein Dsin_017544 [Dipteronia sinensis]|uniref:Leucine-rich repeat-containing N-terminal plant-type domain-containing protein n=1 Tax=Dipteronia sinensis TaxID=43782 RepID=A0AAE0AFW0_9ROSI|nr:hypothetical protein Dsin_017544 [Dipteronia sinensis]